MKNHYIDPTLGAGMLIGFVLGLTLGGVSNGTLVLIGLSALLGYAIANRGRWMGKE